MMMTRLRSLLFNVAFFGWTGVMCLVLVWTLFLPWRTMVRVVRIWLAPIAWMEKHIAGITFKIVGREHVPDGACIIAAKHQSAWETFKIHLLFPDPAIVLKQELLDIPLWGRFLGNAGMIPVDRSGGARALVKMMTAAHKAADDGRKIIIFPQGTRVPPGDQRPYKSGIAGLYQELNIPVVPMALNSGLYWPKTGFIRKPGEITIEFLPPIPPGLPRDVFMTRLKDELESASDRLLENGNSASKKIGNTGN